MCDCCTETCLLAAIIFFVFSLFICILISSVFSFYWFIEWEDFEIVDTTFIFYTFIVTAIFFFLLIFIALDRVCCTLYCSCECNGCSYFWGCLALLDVIVIIVFLFLSWSDFNYYTQLTTSDIISKEDVKIDHFLRAIVGLTPEEKEQYYGKDIGLHMFKMQSEFFIAMGVITIVLYLGLCISPCILCCV